MLGVPAADREPLKRWSEAILGLSDAVAGGETAARAVAAFRDAKTEMRAVRRCAGSRSGAPRPKDDLLTRLVEAEVDGERLTGEDILGFFQLLLLAGSETTTNLIGSAVLCLAEQPGSARPPAGGPRAAAGGDRRGAALPAARAGGLPPDPARRGDARQDDPGREARAGDDRLREPRSPAVPRSRPIRHRAAIRTRTSRSATASTSASGRHWLASRPGSPSPSSWSGRRGLTLAGRWEPAEGLPRPRPVPPAHPPYLTLFVQIQLDS